ncbi:MAG TPA: NnrS family protein [Rhodospirillaceae bacterium]|nr:NnrS family protein [Rhodospirillaceae bacterium]
MFADLPFLRAGFRPFFLFAGLFAMLHIPVWLVLITGQAALPLAFDPMLWHGHEMLFGFGTAAVAGFLLTAVPNWTGSRGVSGWPLALLAGLWLAARLAFLAGPGLTLWAAPALDLAFLPTLAAMLAGPLIRTGKSRNLVFLGLLTVLCVADGLILAAMTGMAETGRNGLALALFTLVLMIGIVGGRIIPAFTQSGLQAVGVAWQGHRLPGLEPAALALLGGVAIAEALAPGAAAGSALCLAAAVAHGLRLAGWQGWKTRRLPLLWVLHLGYLWIPLGLAAVGLAGFGLLPLPHEAALHGLTVGAIGTMTLGVMSRAALGHGGRPLVPAAATVAAYLLVWSAAWLRLSAPLADTHNLLWASGLAWSGGFALFVLVYAPICLRPRADGRPG